MFCWRMTVTTPVMPGKDTTQGQDGSMKRNKSKQFLLKYFLRQKLSRTRLDRVSTSPGFLDVKMRSELVEQPRRVVGALGGSVSLTCRVRVDPSLVEEAEIYWTKDGRGTLKQRTFLGKYSANCMEWRYFFGVFRKFLGGCGVVFTEVN